MADYQVIDDPNDPRLADIPLNKGGEFDPQAFISGEDSTTDPYKQALIDKIVSGATDYTYGPGSPGATSADMRQKTGARDNKLQTGDIALPEKDYNLFTPKEREQLRIADTSWIKEGQPTPAGSVERYFGSEAGGFDPKAFIERKPQPSPTPSALSPPDIHAFMEPPPAEPSAAPEPAAPDFSTALGKGIQAAAKAIGSTGTKLNLPPVPQLPRAEIPQAGTQLPITSAAPFPQAQPLPTPSVQPEQAVPVIQGTMEGLQQTAMGLIPHSMEQFKGLAQMMGAPTDPFGFFQSALQQGLVNAQTAQAAIKSGPLSKEAGVAYGSIIPQYLMMAGGLGQAGAIPSAGTVARSLAGQNILPRAQEIGAIGYTGGGREVSVPEALQPQAPQYKAASVQGLKQPPTQARIKAVMDEYDAGSERVSTARDIASELDQIENLPPSLRKAVDDFYGAVQEEQQLYGERGGLEEEHGDALINEAYKHSEPPPPTQPPTAPQLAAPVAPTESVNPVPGSGKFRRSYRIDKEMGDQMEAIGAARESGYLRAELQSRNMLHELSPQQEADLGRLLVSDRLKTVNPNHPQIIFDSVARGIESDPAIAKALDYYKKEIKPEIESWRKRAGLSEKAAAGKEAGFISLIVKNPEPLTPAQGGIVRPFSLGRTTRFARLAEGQAKEYSTNMRDILSESYSEAIKKARVREFYDSTVANGITEDGKYEELPPQLQHDLTAATQPELNQMPIQNNPNFGFATKLGDLARLAGRGYQRLVTGFSLAINSAEMMNHMRRQLNLVAAKPPVGMGIMARLEALAPYFGPKLGAFKRAVMEDMSTPGNQAILKDIFDAGGGSSRSFGERYESHIPGLRQAQKGVQALLFRIPKGKGVMGWDLRMRVQLEKMRRSVEGNVDPQRMREFANQIGQYGSHPDWFVRGLRKINPYAATSLPMRITELKTAFGVHGFQEPLSKKAWHNAETIARGTGGTLLAMASANYLLSGKWPWQNDKGHEFDVNTGVKDKTGKTIYLKTRAFAPEFSRPLSTLSIPDVLRERKARHPQYLAAGMTGPANQALSLVSGPGQNLAFTATTGKVPYLLKRPGEGPEFMDVATLKKGEAAKGVSRGGRQLLKALSSVNPLGERLASQHEEAAPGALGYLEEPIPGVRPFGDIFSTSYENRGAGGYSQGSGRGSGGRSSGRGTGGR